jgi:SAM-dependent methyltransferase
MTDEVRDYWDAQAAAFDAEPDHGLLDPPVREAWRALLLSRLPPAPADVVDLGCGTGSLAVLLAEAGHAVRGLDLSERMVAAATAKATAAGANAHFAQGDAAEPPYDPGSCDVVLARHVLWALPDPHDAVGRWVRLLRPGGRLVLVEGSWSTGTGLTASSARRSSPATATTSTSRCSTTRALWGRVIDDERYLLVSR